MTRIHDLILLREKKQGICVSRVGSAASVGQRGKEAKGSRKSRGLPSPLRRSGRGFRRLPPSARSDSASSVSLASFSRWLRNAPLCFFAAAADGLTLDSSSEAGSDTALESFVVAVGDGELVLCLFAPCLLFLMYQALPSALDRVEGNMTKPIWARQVAVWLSDSRFAVAAAALCPPTTQVVSISFSVFLAFLDSPAELFFLVIGSLATIHSRSSFGIHGSIVLARPRVPRASCIVPRGFARRGGRRRGRIGLSRTSAGNSRSKRGDGKVLGRELSVKFEAG